MLTRLVWFLIVLFKCADGSEETFSEELFIKPLPTGHVYSYFQFTTKWDVNPEETKRTSAGIFLL